MREMKDSGVEWIGEIPRHWKLVRLKNLIESREGGAWGEDSTGSVEDMVCLRIADFDYQKYRFKTQGDLTIRHYKRNVIERLLLSVGDILVEKSGGGEKTPVGRAVIFDKDFPALYANFMDRLRCKKDVNPYWLLYNWVNLYTNNYTRPYIKQTTGIQNLDISTLLSSQFAAIPPDYEQNTILNAISEKTERVNTLIQNVQTQIEKLKAYKQSLITEVVTRGLNPTVPMKDSGVDWIGEIPEHWDVVKLKYITRISRGLFNHRPRNDSRLYDGEYPFIQTGDVARSDKYITTYSQTLNELGIKVSKVFPKGTITMTIAANVGDVAILNFNAYFPDSVVGFTVKDGYDENYVYYLFKALKETFVRASIANTQLNLNIERSKEIRAAISYDTQEQKRIAFHLDKKCAQIDRLIAIKQAKIEKLEQYKRSLIYEYVTGKKEVV